MVSLIGVKAEHLPYIWDKAEPLLSKVIARSNGEHDIETIKSMLRGRTAQLWVGVDGEDVIHAGLTHILNFPTGKKAVEIFFLGGERMNDWLDHIVQIEAWAKSLGADEVRIHGRKGWGKVMKEYTPVYTTLSKRI
jgi:hypothetical protein